MPCIFFSIINQIFEDKNGKEIIDIKNVFISPFAPKIYKNFDINIKGFEMNNNQNKKLIEFIKKEKAFSIPSKKNIFLEFSHRRRMTNLFIDVENVIVLREIKNKKDEIINWISVIKEDNEKNDIINKLNKMKKINNKEGNYILLIYKDNNMMFKLISPQGKIYSFKHIIAPDNKKSLIYDVYLIKEKEED